MAESLIEGVLERVAFDYGVEFLVADGSLVRVEGKGTVGDGGADSERFDAETPSPVASTLLHFLHRSIRVLVDGASLSVVAEEQGLVLRVEPSIDYEAWSVIRPDGSRLVCTASGEVARWPAS